MWGVEGQGPLDELLYCREDSLQFRSFLFFTLKNSKRQWNTEEGLTPDGSSISWRLGTDWWATDWWLTCDGSLSALSLPPKSVAPPLGHIQVLITASRWLVGSWGALARWWWWGRGGGRRRSPLAERKRRWPHHAAAVEGGNVLASELLPLNAGAAARLFVLEVEIPALVGHLNAHAEQPLKVLLELVVVHGPEEVPPYRPRLHIQGPDAPQTRNFRVARYFRSCWCWHHRHVPEIERKHVWVEVRGRGGALSFNEVLVDFYRHRLTNKGASA